MAIFDKAASRRRWAEARGTWPRDEYDCMIGPVLRLLERDASIDELRAYLGKELLEHFGVPAIESDLRRVSETLKKWFSDKWVGN
jgi:hypothetical protein